MSLNTLDKDEIIQFSKLANDWWDEEGSMSFLHSMSETRTKFIKLELIEHFNIIDKNKLFKGLNILDLGKLFFNIPYPQPKSKIFFLVLSNFPILIIDEIVL